MKQPRALYLLNFVSMWECFSYYGMRVLLVLFMAHAFDFSDTTAFGLYALYTTLVELGGLAGGIIADRYLGLKRSIMLGGWTILFGHVCLTIPDDPRYFYLGLGLIIAGTSLFRSNVAAFLGEFYEEQDLRRESGYTIYYTGINIGGFLAAILCGGVAEVYGWHAGFGLAAIGMLAGNVALLFGQKLLLNAKEQKVPTKQATGLTLIGLILAGVISGLGLYYHEIVTLWVPVVAVGIILYAFRQLKGCSTFEKAGLKKLAFFIFFLIIFYGCEEQLGSSLVLFAERHLDRDTLFGIIPAASLVTFNPLTILVAGPLLSRLFLRLKLSDAVKIQGSFLLLGLSFCLLYLSCFTVNADGMVSVIYAITSIVLIALGEILIGPTIYTVASKVAPSALQGLTMGLVTLGFSLANLFSGVLSQMMAVAQESNSIAVYSSGFGFIALLAFALVGLFQLRKKVFAYE